MENNKFILHIIYEELYKYIYLYIVEKYLDRKSCTNGKKKTSEVMFVN